MGARTGTRAPRGAFVERHRVALVVLAVVGALVVGFREPSAATAGPFVPSGDGVVLERLPSFTEGPRSRELGRLRKELSARPGDLTLALRVARAAIELSRARSDPRYLGQAESALRPFWEMPSPPTESLVLRATIRQSSHDFEGALADLDVVLRATPDDAQAWLTRAVVRTVLARYDEAKADCAELVRRAPALVVAVCSETIASLTGDAAGAYARLALREAATAPTLSPGERAWASSVLGELAVRAGKNDAARAHFAASLLAEPGDPYVLGALSDLDLDTGRAGDVVARLRGHEDNDGLLLRLALAEKALGHPDAPAHTALLADRFRASALRGDVVHRREEARFRLVLEGDADRALGLAAENWAVQREVADARVLLEAALATKRPDRAAPVLAWLAASRCEEPALVRLSKELSR
jgi:tetratricopeptide (TPR) repeat protein